MPIKKMKSARFQVDQVGDNQDVTMDDEQALTIKSDSVHCTQYRKSLRHYLTREVLPVENNYRNLLSFGRNSIRGFIRPTIEELRDEGEIKHADQVHEENVEKNEKKGNVVKLGWIDGVYMPCLLNIWGVMLFLRLTWVMGQCGIVQGLLVMTLCNVVTSITALSMSAVTTNGQIKGGGVYFMISRALGPEFGGAIGLMFTLANSIAVSMYIVGFAESLLDCLQEYVPSWTGLVDQDLHFRLNDVRIIGSVTLVLIMVLGILGMDWVTRVQKLLLLLLICSQLDFVIGSFLPRPVEVRARGFTGWSLDTARENLGSNYQEGQSFFSVFAVFFPAVTGIVAGANMSGDLKDPASAIPKGTLGAIVSTYVTYLVYGLIVTFVYLPSASGSVEEYLMWTNSSTPHHSLPDYRNCTEAARGDDPCQYGTLFDQQTMSVISYTGFLIYGGCFAATISSAIASMVGAPRVLQALARDKLYPRIEIFAPGVGVNNNPVRGFVVVFFISLACILIGDLNIISSLLSNFFVAVYALVNFSVFHASITKSPGWRPAFKYYSPWVSLFGMFLCLFSMFAMDWITALITLVITAVLYLYIYYRAPEANWGSSAQAQVFVNALKAVQSLTDTKDHVKNYRPKVLVLTGNPAHRPALVDFANLLTKKLSLLICGHVLTPGTQNIQSLKENSQAWLSQRKIKGFCSLYESFSFEGGAKTCLASAGLGKLTPNMVLIGFKTDWVDEVVSAREYFNVLQACFDQNYSVGVLRVGSGGLDYSKYVQLEHNSTTKERSRHCSSASYASVQLSGVYDTETVLNIPCEDVSVGTSEDDNQSIQDVDNLSLKDPNNLEKREAVKIVVDESEDVDSIPEQVLVNMNQFQGPRRAGHIDVWWLYDDGGLTLLLPYILTTRRQFSQCKLRVFALANKKDELDRETRNMAALLAKFRIDFSSVVVIPDVTKRASDASRDMLEEMLDKLPEGAISYEERCANKEKTNRHLRLSELLQENSRDSQMIFLTLPMPRKGQVSGLLYLAWLDMMTKNLPPTLLIRGNQTSVLTFYS